MHKRFYASTSLGTSARQRNMQKGFLACISLLWSLAASAKVGIVQYRSVKMTNMLGSSISVWLERCTACSCTSALNFKLCAEAL